MMREILSSSFGGYALSHSLDGGSGQEAPKYDCLPVISYSAISAQVMHCDAMEYHIFADMLLWCNQTKRLERQTCTCKSRFQLNAAQRNILKTVMSQQCGILKCKPHAALYSTATTMYTVKFSCVLQVLCTPILVQLPSC